MEKILLHGKCDVCQNEFTRELNSKVENEFGISRRLKDMNTPAKVVCASSDCKTKVVKINKAYRNAKTNPLHNQKNPYRNSTYNDAVKNCYADVSGRFRIVQEGNDMLFPTLILLTLKVVRDRQEPCRYLRMLRSFQDLSVNLERDDNNRVKINIMQCWHKFCKDRGFSLTALFRQSNPISLPDLNEFQHYNDADIDTVFSYIMHENSHVSVDDFIDALKPYSAFNVKAPKADRFVFEDSETINFSFTSLHGLKKPVGKKWAFDQERNLIDIQQDKAFVLSQPFRADTVEMTSLGEFATFLNNATEYDYAMYGISNHTNGMHTIATVKDAARYKIDKDTVFSRTKGNYSFKPNQGILWLDFDDISSFQDALNNLFTSAPELSGYSYIWQPSASANVSNGKNQYSGETGLHAYFIIDDMTNAPAVVDTINKRAVIAGITKPNEALVDPAAVRPIQLDSVCCAVPQTGFSQDRKARLVQGRKEIIQSNELTVLTPVENARYLEIVKAHKKENKDEAKLSNIDIKGSSHITSEHQVLDMNSVIRFKDNTSATVEDIINNQAMYKSKSVLCPITGKPNKTKLYFNASGLITLHTQTSLVSKGKGTTFLLHGATFNNNIVAANTDSKIVVQKASGKSRILRG